MGLLEKSFFHTVRSYFRHQEHDNHACYQNIGALVTNAKVPNVVKNVVGDTEMENMTVQFIVTEHEGPVGPHVGITQDLEIVFNIASHDWAAQDIPTRRWIGRGESLLEAILSWLSARLCLEPPAPPQEAQDGLR